jgi:hypothetical protein
LKLFRLLIIFILLIKNTFSYAQYEITIDATVFDKETDQPIAFTNIGFVNKNIKTISDVNGRFTLIYNEQLIC